MSQLDVRALIERGKLRSRIIEVHALEQSIAWNETVRREHPKTRKQMEARRAEANRALDNLNQRLRESGLEPMELSLSLGEKRQKLKRLEAETRAEIARFQGDSSVSPGKAERHAPRTRKRAEAKR